MGCDIHGWIEIKSDDKWIAISELKSDERNYGRFAALASVRGMSDMKPLGIPNDISETVKYWIKKWDTDGHSHSYMPLEQAAEIFLSTEFSEEVVGSFAKEYPANYFFGYEEHWHDCEEQRLVFWFDS